jgi:hypothetical protein
LARNVTAISEAIVLIFGNGARGFLSLEQLVASFAIFHSHLLVVELPKGLFHAFFKDRRLKLFELFAVHFGSTVVFPFHFVSSGETYFMAT